LAGRVTAYPGAPTLTWMIAKRVCNPYEDADAFISFTGRKGSSKSTSSIAFAESLAGDIAYLRKQNESPEKFFNIEHIKSVTESGAIELLTSGILKKENSVILLDDTGTQWGARNFQTMINKYLNAILQIARVYKCVIICNFIAQKHIDVQARGMTDFRAEMLYKNVKEEQAVFKFFYLEQGEDKEYKKYLTWKGKRLKWWVIGKPSEKLYAEYKKMRQDNTDDFILDAGLKIQAKLNPKKGESGRLPKSINDYASMPVVLDNVNKVRELKGQGVNIEKISQKLGISRYWVGKCLSIKDVPRDPLEEDASFGN
jgi:hypothetical protein